jgi:hypothetical protein
MVSWRGFMLWLAGVLGGAAADMVRPDFIVIGMVHLLGLVRQSGPDGPGVLVGPFEFTGFEEPPKNGRKNRQGRRAGAPWTLDRSGVPRRQQKHFPFLRCWS